MSKNWSSYEKDGKIMESWRNYVEGPPAYRFLQEGPDYILKEQDLQELFGKDNWEKLVDRFAVEDDGAADLAQRLGLKSAEVTDAQGQALDVAQIEAKIKQVMDIARKSNDPELADAAQDLAQNAQQVAQGASAEEATADDDQGGTESGQAQEQVGQYLGALAKASDLDKYKELYDKLTQLTRKQNQWFVIDNWLKTGKDNNGVDKSVEEVVEYISSFGLQGDPPQPHHSTLNALLTKSQDQQSKAPTPAPREEKIRAAVLDLVDATNEKWDQVRNTTEDERLQQAMDYMEEYALSEQIYNTLPTALIENVSRQELFGLIIEELHKSRK